MYELIINLNIKGERTRIRDYFQEFDVKNE